MKQDKVRQDAGKKANIDKVSPRSQLEKLDETRPGAESVRARILSKISISDQSLESIANQVSEELKVSRDGVIEQIRGLRRERGISVTERKPRITYADYLLSYHSNWFWAVLIASWLSVLTVFASAGAALYLRYFFGSVLVLFIPGYSVVELLYSRKNEKTEEEAYSLKIALSVGLSLIIVASVSLVLNYTSLGITLVPLTAILTLMTIVFVVLASLRKYAQYRLSLYAVKEKIKESST